MQLEHVGDVTVEQRGETVVLVFPKPTNVDPLRVALADAWEWRLTPEQCASLRTALVRAEGANHA